MIHVWLNVVCSRPEDGTLWRPSYPDGYNEGTALASLLSRDRKRGCYYFRGVRRVHRWWWFDYWVDTGEVWQPGWREFKTHSQREALRL